MELSQEAWSNSALFKTVKELIGHDPTVEEMLVWLLGFNRGQKEYEATLLEAVEKYVPLLLEVAQAFRPPTSGISKLT